VRIKSLVVAVLAFGGFALLGIDVVRYGEPAALLAWEPSLLDHSALVAWWLTWTCYGDVLIPVAVILLIVAWLAPAWRARIIFSIVMLLLCWRGADFFQHIFARPRPLHWVVKHETAFSYPSSHAAIVTGFYGLWAAMLYMSELPRALRSTAALLLVVLGFAICWSRLALGAHYVTDLAGGALLAVGFVGAAWAAVPVNMTGVVAGRAKRAEE
jgi:membrane-associated phospholipid phosphatase